MPVMMKLEYNGAARIEYPVATEEELLDFVNQVREAGGEKVISALFPSIIGDPKSCLLAKGLNFNCYIDGSERDAWEMELDINIWDHPWEMQIDYGSPEDAEAMADTIATKLGLNRMGSSILLPEHIGHAARAFDTRKAFTKYATVD